MTDALTNELKRDVEDCISKFQFQNALELLNEVSANSEIEFIKIKMNILFLLGKSCAAIQLYERMPEENRRRATIWLVDGLLGNLEFFEAATRALSELKKNPAKIEIIIPILNVLLIFQQFDCIKTLLASKYVQAKSIPAAVFLRLAARTQLAGREDESKYYLGIYLERAKKELPMQVPWLLTHQGNKNKAVTILKKYLGESVNSKERFLEHIYFLKAELPELVDKNTDYLNITNDTTVSNDIELIFTSKKYPPPLWNDVLNRILWKYSLRYEGNGCDLEDWIFKKSRLSAISSRYVHLANKNPAALKFLNKYQNNIVEEILPLLNKSEGPSMLVTSHSIYPGALKVLFNYFPDLYFIRTAVLPFNNTEITSRAFNIGPPFMSKHNLLEFSRIDKHIRRGGKVVFYMDNKGLRSNLEVFKFSELQVTYNDMLMPYIWHNNIDSFWIDADFNGQKFNFELERMPRTTDYAIEEAWKSSFLESFHKLMCMRLNGQKGICNPNVHILESLIPQQYSSDFDKITRFIDSYN